MTINDFRGQVRISDIQAAFDEIVNRINSMIDIYNTSETLADADYTKGSPVLSSSGYTLTIGGLKSLLGSYDGTLLGCRVYKLSDNSVYVSRGIYIKDGQIINIPGGVADGENGLNLKDLFYSVSQESFLYASRVQTQDVLWTSPTLVSNTSWGNVTASNNSGTAWQIAAGENKEWTMFSGNYTERRKASITWNFPEEVKISQVAFNLKVNSNNSVLRVLAGDTEILNKPYEGENDLEEDVSINAGGVACRKLTIELSSDEGGITSSIFSNLVITGTRKQYTFILEQPDDVYTWNTQYIDIPDDLTVENQVVSGFTSNNYITLDLGGDCDGEIECQIVFNSGTVPSSRKLSVANFNFDYGHFGVDYYSNTHDQWTFRIYQSSAQTYGTGMALQLPRTFLTDNTAYSFYFKVTSESAVWKVKNLSTGVEYSYNFDHLITWIDMEKLKLTQLGHISKSYSGVSAGPFTGSIDLNQTFIKYNGDLQFATVGDKILTGDIIKITNLNWKSENLIINNIDGVQLEHPGMSITNQNRSVDIYGGNWENVDTSNDPKFVVYTTNVVTNDPGDISQVDFQGINILGSYRSSAQYRRHWLTQILSLIFIPYKFIISDRRVKRGGRYCYNVNLNNK